MADNTTFCATYNTLFASSDLTKFGKLGKFKTRGEKLKQKMRSFNVLNDEIKENVI